MQASGVDGESKTNLWKVCSVDDVPRVTNVEILFGDIMQ